MAHNNRIRLPGFWTGGSVILPAEMEALDQAQYQEINGDLGGTWAPTSQILIGGSGLRVSGPFIANDAVTVTVQGVLTINPFAFLTAAAGSFVTLGGLTLLSGTMQVSGAGYINITNAPGLQIASGGSMAVLAGGQWEIKNGGFGFVDGGGIIQLTGTALNGSEINVGAYGNVLFTTATSKAIWTASSLAWFQQNSVLTVQANTTFGSSSVTLVQGTSGGGNGATWTFGDYTAAWVNGTSDPTGPIWHWGQHSTQNLDVGHTVSDRATHTTYGTWTWENTASIIWKGAFIADTNSSFQWNPTTSPPWFQCPIHITADIATTADPGADYVYRKSFIKAWFTASADGSGHITVTDGLNVSSAAVASTDVQVDFARNFATDQYVAMGYVIYATECAIGLPINRFDDHCIMKFFTTFGGGSPSSVDMTTLPSGAMVTVFFFGAQ